MPLSAGQAAILLAASAGAGAMNALAGGGTLLTFPALLLLGQPAIVANATSTVALLPGAAASLAGYRREVAKHRDWLRRLLLPRLRPRLPARKAPACLDKWPRQLRR